MREPIYHNGRTHAEHCAWLDSLEGDEKRIVHMPIGHLFAMAVVAELKRALAQVEMTAAERLRFLDGIEKCISGPVTGEAVAAIEPSDDGSRKIMREIHQLHISQQITAFANGDVFSILSKLNPSLLVALRLCR